MMLKRHSDIDSKATSGWVNYWIQFLTTLAGSEDSGL